MTTLILPGFSQKNKIWAEHMRAELSLLGNVSFVEWQHWETGAPIVDFIEVEAQRISSQLVSPINLVAKSIGTLIAMKVVDKKPEYIKKIILCGIPIRDFSPGDEENYKFLNKLEIKNLLCIQNESDNHGTFDEVQTLLFTINPKITLISKPRSDHEYPYSEDFKSFLI